MGKRPRRHIERGERLRAAREQRALTQEQVADALGKTQSHYSQWENGYKWPDDEATLSALQAVLSVPHVWLTYGAADGVTPPAWAVAAPRPPIREAKDPAKRGAKTRGNGMRQA